MSYLKRRFAIRSMFVWLPSILISLSNIEAKEHLGAYAGRQTVGRSMIITSQSGHRLRLTPYGNSIIRIQTVRIAEDFFPDDRYEMVESHDWEGAFEVMEDSSSITAAIGFNNGLSITINKQTLQLFFTQTGSGSHLLEQHESTWWNGDTITTPFLFDENEHFTGLGHGYYGREQRIDLHGTKVHRNYGTEHGQQAPLIVPFFLSSKGYGLFLNSTFTNTFNFGHEKSYEVTVNGDGRMDYFIILGPEFREILDRYTQLTGRPRLLPKAAFGLALSDKGNDHNSPDPSDEQWWRKKIAAHRKAGFPLDHIVNDNRWRAGGGQRCLSHFDWDRTRYPDPKKYADWVKSNGLIVTLDFNRCIASHSDGWQSAFNIPEPEKIDFNDSAPDLTNSEVRQWFWNLFWTKSLDPALHYPGDALWIDEFDEMGKAPLSMVMNNGRTWQEMRNYWFFLIAKTLVQEGWDKGFQGTKRPFVWVRGMTAGGQRYATLWSGDIKPSYDDMRTQVRSMQLAGLSGFPYWGHDAGGFNNWEENHGPNDTMYRQWSMAFGCFSPFWKPHGIGESRWPLDRPAIVQHDAIKYSQLRYTLMPYIYTYAHRAFTTGVPIARAMVIDYQHDPLAWKYDLQYFWGNEMLVAPNCSDGENVSVWLPEGRWFDFWNDSVLNGNQILSYTAPTGKLPLFVKAGSIIPMGRYALSTAMMNSDSVTVHVYTGADASFELYEDDGKTEDYRKDTQKRTTQITYRHTDGVLTIAAAVGNYHHASTHRMVQIEYHGVIQKPCFAVNGKALRLFRTMKEAVKAKEGMVWNAGTKSVTVLLKKRSVSDPIIISMISDCL